MSAKADAIATENMKLHGLPTKEAIETMESKGECANWGNCPQCGEEPGYVNIGKVHFMVCNGCRTHWCIGANLFSSWRDETEEDWAKNGKLLDDCLPVHSIYISGHTGHRIRLLGCTYSDLAQSGTTLVVRWSPQAGPRAPTRSRSCPDHDHDSPDHNRL